MEVFYLDFVTKKNSVKGDELITLIHEYCVYESFERIGWLFTEIMPKKPEIVKQERLFRSVLKDKIAHTFNDKNRMLFRHMLAIIDFEGDKDSDKNYRYGTCEILKMISENPNISIDELRIALDVTDRTIARYISELKNKGIIERKGPDNGGEWKIK